MAHSATCSHLAPSADRVCKPLDSEEEQGPHCCHLKVENSFHRVQPWQTHREELWRFSTAGCPCSRWREGEYWLICILGLSWQQEQATLTINLKHQYILKKKKKRPTECLSSLKNALFTALSTWRMGQRGNPSGVGRVPERNRFMVKLLGAGTLL